MAKTQRLRGPWTRSKPDGPPACPGCGASRSMTLSQPDQSKPNQLLGSCENPDCECWTVFARIEGPWVVAQRISAEEAPQSHLAGRLTGDKTRRRKSVSPDDVRRCRRRRPCLPGKKSARICKLAFN